MGADAENTGGERRMSMSEGLIVVDARRAHQLGEIADAARTLREAMERYRTEQEALVAQGMTMDELVTRNYPHFEAVTAAEDALFTLVDAVGARGKPRAGS